MGGTEHSQNEFAHKNNDMNAHDQSKQGQDTEIGTDNPNEPESEGTDDGNVGNHFNVFVIKNKKKRKSKEKRK
jgi:hypothetical protein